ncbi:MAG: glycoside hydrolase family 88 protein [Acidobacteriales bacterium]|nr:glycoside hydrolase family 88 protein [Terriglobales bacterium]
MSCPFGPPTERGGWPDACLALGLTASLTLPGAEQAAESLERLLDQVIDQRGCFFQPLRRVDQCMIGHSLLHLLERRGSSRLEKAIREIGHFLIREHERTAEGSLPYRADWPDIAFVDTVGMICPFLARYGRVFAEPEATKLSVLQLCAFLSRGMEAETFLPFHAYRTTVTGGLGPVGWTRGVGWLAVGLADSLADLPKDAHGYEELGAATRRLYEQVFGMQRENGCWAWLMNHPYGRVDTSGSAMLAYAAERCMNTGLLDPTVYEAMTGRTFRGLLNLTRTDGFVDGSLGECINVGLYPNSFTPTLWSQGFTAAFLALYCQRLEEGRVLSGMRAAG